MGKSVARLFEQFQPSNYQLDLVPDREAMTFHGTVTVRGKKAGRPSQRLTFHQKGLTITAAKVIKHDKKGDQPIEVTRINNQNSLDEVRLHSEAMIYPGDYTVTMEFTGNITKPMNGIYPCFFSDGKTEKQLIATQFESHYARNAFPCIDEPEAKATFDLTLTTPKGETVLSNTPAKSEKTTGRTITTSFETTPRMSTYLLAFVYGEMGFTESKTKRGIPVRAYGTPANAPHTQYSADIAAKILDFFEAYFGVPYPLAKLDMVALPDFTVGAMENWGLVTFREQTMLYNPTSSGIETQQLVALVTAHELSHQWFGNLVTMKWWDDLWLNESFANMMEYLAVDALYPEWHIWEQFVSHEAVAAKRRDSLADVQSVRTQVDHPDQLNTIFDPSIVYAKGGTLLHMLMHHIGQKAFQAGLTAYFTRHRYENTTAGDLWTALGAASGQDVSSFMSNWLEKPGYPLISVGWQPGSTSLSLEQTRFLSDPTAKADRTTIWQVPLASAGGETEPAILTKSEMTAELSGSADQPLLLNHDGTSYFVPYYLNSDHLQAITHAIRQHETSTIDRLLLLDNYLLLQRAGVAQTTNLLDLISSYEGETSEAVWGMLAMAFGEARRLSEGDDRADKALDALIAGLVEPHLPKLGWDDSPDDNAQTLHLRGLLYSLVAGAKSPAIIDEGLRRFRAFKEPADLPASTRSTIYFIAARHGEKADFDRLLALHETLRSAEDKEELAGGLTGAKQTDRIAELLPLFTSGSIRRQDALHWFAWLIRNRYSRPATWQWLKDNWAWVVEEFGDDKTFSYFARYSGGAFSRQTELEAFRQFFADKRDDIALSHEVKLAEQEIISRVAWRERNEAAVKAWLQKL